MSFLQDVTARRWYFISSAIVLMADQLTKILADTLLQGRTAVTIIPGFFNLWYSRNRGGLFGFFGTWDEPWRTILLTAFPLAAVILIGVFLAKTNEPDRSTLFGLALVLGGATGNLIDRVFRGEVIDFLDVYVSHQATAEWFIARFNTAHWPTFNIADSAIVVGACLLILDVLRPEPKSEKANG